MSETHVERCDLCGEPLPEGEQMFRIHGYSGPCPKAPLPELTREDTPDAANAELLALRAERDELRQVMRGLAALSTHKNPPLGSVAVALAGAGWRDGYRLAMELVALFLPAPPKGSG